MQNEHRRTKVLIFLPGVVTLGLACLRVGINAPDLIFHLQTIAYAVIACAFILGAMYIRTMGIDPKKPGKE